MTTYVDQGAAGLRLASVKLSRLQVSVALPLEVGGLCITGTGHVFIPGTGLEAGHRVWEGWGDEGLSDPVGPLRLRNSLGRKMPQ